jgi:hypothetical protein
MKQVPPDAASPEASAPTAEARKEQRNYRRIRYWSVQRIALGDHAQPIDTEAFRSVQCFDISQGGFSFLADEVPGCETLLLAMVVRQETTYIRSQVVSCRASNLRQGRFVVGCRFLDRVAG